MHRSFRAGGFLLVVLLTSTDAAAQEKPGAPAVTPASGRSIRLEGQLQFQASSTTVDTAVGWDAELRRMRLTAVGEAGEGLSGTLQTDFDSNRARVRDAFIEYRVIPALTVRAGQFKIPFNGIEMVSSKRLLVIERGNRIRGFRAATTSGFLADAHLAARNRGFMALAKLPGGRLTLQAGGWLGSGEAGEDDDGKELAARLEWSALPLPEKTSRPLVLAVAAVTNGYLGGPRDTLAVIGDDSLLVRDAQYATAFEGWIEYGTYLLPGLHVAANVVAGENPEALEAEREGVDFGSFLGLQAWGELLLPLEGFVSAVAPAFRADRFDPDTGTDDDANLLLTPGLNVYVGPNVKTQLNYDVLVPQGDGRDTESAFRFQAQLLF